jgi:hypothetical protein
MFNTKFEKTAEELDTNSIFLPTKPSNLLLKYNSILLVDIISSYSSNSDIFTISKIKKEYDKELLLCKYYANLV